MLSAGAKYWVSRAARKQGLPAHTHREPLHPAAFYQDLTCKPACLPSSQQSTCNPQRMKVQYAVPYCTPRQGLAAGAAAASRSPARQCLHRAGMNLPAQRPCSTSRLTMAILCCAVGSAWFERASGVLILFNVVIMGLYEYSMPRTRHRLQRTGELVLAFVFLAEVILRFVAAGECTP